MSDVEPDAAHIGCCTVDMLNGVPRTESVVMPCAKCGTDLFVSTNLLSDLRGMGYSDDRIVPLCLYTCLVVQQETESILTENQRAWLNEKGISDEQIDKYKGMLDEIIQKEGS